MKEKRADFPLGAVSKFLKYFSDAMYHRNVGHHHLSEMIVSVLPCYCNDALPFWEYHVDLTLCILFYPVPDVIRQNKRCPVLW